MKNTLSVTIVVLTIMTSFIGCQNKKEGAADEQYVAEEKRIEGEYPEDLWTQGEINEFLVHASMVDKMQIRLGDMTIKKAANEDVRNYGNLLKNDHTESLRALQALVQGRDMNLPDTLNDNFNRKIQELEVLSGQEFDRRLLDMMILDHKKEIAKFENAKEQISVENEFYNWVDNALPKLHRHEQKAKQLKNALEQD